MRERSLAPFIVFGLGAMLCLAALLLYGTEAIAADVCLDRGGAFDYLRGVCRDAGASLPVPPLMQRNPLVGLCGTAGGLMVLGAGLALALRRKEKNHAES